MEVVATPATSLDRVVDRLWKEAAVRAHPRDDEDKVETTPNPTNWTLQHVLVREMEDFDHPVVHEVLLQPRTTIMAATNKRVALP